MANETQEIKKRICGKQISINETTASKHDTQIEWAPSKRPVEIIKHDLLLIKMTVIIQLHGMKTGKSVKKYLKATFNKTINISLKTRKKCIKKLLKKHNTNAPSIPRPDLILMRLVTHYLTASLTLR